MTRIQLLICSAMLATAFAAGRAEEQEIDRSELDAWASDTLLAGISVKQSADRLAKSVTDENRTELLASVPFGDPTVFKPSPPSLLARADDERDSGISEEAQDENPPRKQKASDGRTIAFPRIPPSNT